MKYDTTRSDAVLAFCWEPRTLGEIKLAFADEPKRAVWALWNLVRRGKVRLTDGYYVSMDKPVNSVWSLAA